MQKKSTTARQASLAAASPRPSPFAAQPTVTTLPAPSAPPSVAPSVAPSAAPTPLPTVASVPVPSPSAPVPAAGVATAPGDDTRVAEIERTLLAYERAYETLNVDAFRSVMDVSPALEKGLRGAFKAFKAYDVEMSGARVDFEGDATASVRVSRVDTVNGRRQPAKKQKFVLSRRGDSWRIVSYAFEP